MKIYYKIINSNFQFNQNFILIKLLCMINIKMNFKKLLINKIGLKNNFAKN